MTRSDIRTRILNGLNESATSPVFWSTTQADQLIAEGSELLAEELQAIKRTAMVALRPGSTYYAVRGIADDLMVPYRVWSAGLNRRLTATTPSQLDDYHERWQTVTGEPEYWFPMGWDWFGIFPHAAAGGGTFRVDYLAWPRPLLDDSDEPEFLGADHDTLVLYGVYSGLLKRWDIQDAQYVFALFLEKIGKGKGRVGERTLQARAWQKTEGNNLGLRSSIVGDRFGNRPT